MLGGLVTITSRIFATILTIGSSLFSHRLPPPSHTQTDRLCSWYNCETETLTVWTVHRAFYCWHKSCCNCHSCCITLTETVESTGCNCFPTASRNAVVSVHMQWKYGQKLPQIFLNTQSFDIFIGNTQQKYNSTVFFLKFLFKSINVFWKLRSETEGVIFLIAATFLVLLKISIIIFIRQWIKDCCTLL